MDLSIQTKNGYLSKPRLENLLIERHFARPLMRISKPNMDLSIQTKSGNLYKPCMENLLIEHHFARPIMRISKPNMDPSICHTQAPIVMKST